MKARPVLLAAGFLAALALRLALLAHVSGNYDLASYEAVASIVRRGGSMYLETARYNYSPLWAWVLAGLAILAERIGTTLAWSVGVFLLLVDGATALVVRRLAGGGRRGGVAAILFFANPVSIFVSSFHLQFDNLAILFLLLAILAAEKPPATRAGTAAALSASLIAKHVTVFFPPLFVKRRATPGLSVAGALVPYAAFAASFLPYARSWEGIRRHVLGYRSLSEDYGAAMLRKIPGSPAWLPTAVFLATVAATIVVVRRLGLPLPRAALMLFIAMLLTVPGICEYYFVWPIALGALEGGAGYAVYTLVVGAFFLGSPDGLNLPLMHLPGWHGIWWSLVLWLAWELREQKERRERRSILSPT